MQSHFNSQSLAELFRDVFLGERSGVLCLRRNDDACEIHFARGLIEFAGSRAGRFDLGDRLVEQHRISPGALTEALTDGAGPADLALALVNRGLLGRQALARAARELADAVLADVFGWDGGTAEFEESSRCVEVLEGDVLSTFRMLLHGIEHIGDFRPVLDAMSDLESALVLRSPSPVPLDKLVLSRTQGFVLSRVDGRTSFAEIISTLPDDEQEPASRFLFGLLVVGVAEYRPALGGGPFRVANLLRDHADRSALAKLQEKTIRQAYTRMRKQNPHEILGVTPAASRAAIERAYAEAKSLFLRERLLPAVREGFRTELGVIESRLVEAYLHLTKAEAGDPRRSRAETDAAAQQIRVDDLLMRPELDKTRTRTEAEEAGRIAETYYSKARQAVRSGDYHNAIQYGKLAISYQPEDARLYYLLADCQARNPEPRWQRQAEQNYTKATELDPWNPEYWLSLGRFYKKRGLNLRARRQFEEALKLVPEHEEASRELKALR